MNNLKSKAGFTLVELVVVIAILAILAGVGTAAYTGYIEKAKEANDISALDAIKTAAMAANVKNGAVENMEVSASDVKINGVIADDGNAFKAEDGATNVREQGTSLKTNSEFLIYAGLESWSLNLETGSSAVWNGTVWKIVD